MILRKDSERDGREVKFVESLHHLHKWLSELAPVNIHFCLEPTFQLVPLTITNG